MSGFLSSKTASTPSCRLARLVGDDRSAHTGSSESAPRASFPIPRASAVTVTLAECPDVSRILEAFAAGGSRQAAADLLPLVLRRGYAQLAAARPGRQGTPRPRASTATALGPRGVPGPHRRPAIRRLRTASRCSRPKPLPRPKWSFPRVPGHPREDAAQYLDTVRHEVAARRGGAAGPERSMPTPNHCCWLATKRMKQRADTYSR